MYICKFCNEQFETLVALASHVKYYMDMGHDKNTAIKMVAKDRGVKKNDIYQATLDKK